MFQLVYLSTAVNLFEEEELNEILQISRTNNSSRDITGLLLYHEGNIIQVLEGEKQQVMNVYYKIERDPRHKGIIKMISGDVSQRFFTGWSMGFKSLSAMEYKDALGYLEPESEDVLMSPETDEDPQAVTLLKTFASATISRRRQS
ncbi:BLUF domain-containing protein [Pontibacter oryzae]|uniref:BLUF domain-containing protein n=1 Tax=Pontibacter oryzae TaxID=2304593 RepID=A0A399SD39_9BACT|nr:BLUF domain-containing protein [Pontibacter oryzae]RIJ41630.1 BLUF domain-containing protein [Pontibacter oryzae]